MISIPVDSADIFMAKQEKNSDRLLLGVIAFLLTAIAAMLGWYLNEQSDNLKRIDTSISVMRAAQTTQGESLSRLEERTKSLERVVYAAKATGAGFKNPEIVRTSFGVNAKFESRTPGPTGEYFMRYVVLSYDPLTSVIRLKFDAQLPNGNKYTNNLLVLKLQPGSIAELTHHFTLSGVPKLYLQVLDIQAPDQAILAIGPKIDSDGKSS